MRHRYFGKKLSRNTNERKRLFVNLARELVKRGSIQTTVARAKAVQPIVEKLITHAKKGDGGLRLVSQVLADKETVKKLAGEAQTRFAKRESGFTRIVRLGPRFGDNTERALLMFVDERVATEVIAPKPEKKKEAKVSKPRTKAKK